MPCRYNTFYGRLLWFDGVEGKRGLTLTVYLFVFRGGGDGAGGGGSNCFILKCVLVFMTYYASNKFSSLLFSPGTLNGHVDNVV